MYLSKKRSNSVISVFFVILLLGFAKAALGQTVKVTPSNTREMEIFIDLSEFEDQNKNSFSDQMLNSASQHIRSAGLEIMCLKYYQLSLDKRRTIDSEVEQQQNERIQNSAKAKFTIGKSYLDAIVRSNVDRLAMIKFKSGGIFEKTVSVLYDSGEIPRTDKAFEAFFQAIQSGVSGELKNARGPDRDPKKGYRRFIEERLNFCASNDIRI